MGYSLTYCSIKHFPIAISALILSGCVSYFKPMIEPVSRFTKVSEKDIVKSTPKKDSVELMPNLTSSLVNIENAIQKMQEKRDGTVTTGRILNLATFGLGASAGFYGLRDGHVNAIKNLAFAGGATYVGSTLFAAPDQAIVYDYGIQALSCISKKRRCVADGRAFV